MKYVLLSLILLCSGITWGQDSPPDTYPSTYMVKKRKHLRLNDLEKSKHPWYIRVWLEKQVIDLWTDKKGKSFGRVTSWVQKYNKAYEERDHPGVFNPFRLHPNRFFIRNVELSSTQVQQMKHIITKSKIKTIPNEHSIGNWAQGFDGFSYVIETLEDNHYQFKTYWTPQIQKGVQEAVIVQDFLEQYQAAADTKQIWSAFTPKIPFQCFSNDTGTHICIEQY